MKTREIRWRPVLVVERRAEIPAISKEHTESPRAGSGEWLANALQLGRAGLAAGHRKGMDITWLTDRIAVGGGIWTAENMAKVARAGVTHIIDMQIEFDDRPLAVEHGIEVFWNPTDDDFEAKPSSLFQDGVAFAQAALEQPEAKLFIHCAAGIHRAPMMALALLGSMGWTLEDARQLIAARRPVVDFADVYVRSVEEFLDYRGSKLNG